MLKKEIADFFLLYLKDDDELMELKRKTSEMETVYDLGTKILMIQAVLLPCTNI